jgi:hypothetical protein
MAQMRSADRVQKCLLFGVDRTYRGHLETDAFDPEADIGVNEATWEIRLASPLPVRRDIRLLVGSACSNAN